MSAPPKKIIKNLSTGATVHVNDHRVRVDLPSSSPSPPSPPYESISSAILNGGCHSFASSSARQHAINYKVPSTYDGVTPSPHGLLAEFCEKEDVDPSDAVGMLTAASMETFSTSSRTAGGVSLDVVVTAGLSNSRAAGADADYFMIGEEDEEQTRTPGTINTIIVTDAPLSAEARVEAYAIAVEAKCAACVDHGVSCAKSPLEFGMGTGTDCCALLSPSRRGVEGKKKGAKGKMVIKYAGKHTLFAEMIGQAVYEATSEAIMINIRYLHGDYARYAAKRWVRTLAATMRGARPCIPPKPMDPMPGAPPSILSMGACSVLAMYLSPLPEKTRLLLAAVAWDRYLGEPPLRLHPVCLAGSAISACISFTPERVYKSPLLGFVGGFLLWVSIVSTFTCGAWLFVRCTEALPTHGPILLDAACRGRCAPLSPYAAALFDLAAWTLRLLLFKSAFSLQLLCTLALQMARFLERAQIDEARSQLSWLCSRDPSRLSPPDLAGATLESLSENLSDGFVAPLFYYALFGPVGALGYRVANGLDSRVGYRGRYEWYGKVSARFDDVINLVPARVTALLLACAAALVRGRRSAGEGLRTAMRDRGRCESPNAGWPMACFAGILGVRLEKKGEYCLGSEGREPGSADVRAGHRVAQVAGGMTVLVAAFATLMQG